MSNKLDLKELISSEPSPSAGQISFADMDVLLKKIFTQAHAREEEERRNIEQGRVILPPLPDEPLSTADSSAMTPEQIAHVRERYDQWFKDHPVFWYGGHMVISPERHRQMLHWDRMGRLYRAHPVPRRKLRKCHMHKLQATWRKGKAHIRRVEQAERGREEVAMNRLREG